MPPSSFSCRGLHRKYNERSQTSQTGKERDHHRLIAQRKQSRHGRGVTLNYRRGLPILSNFMMRKLALYVRLDNKIVGTMGGGG